MSAYLYRLVRLLGELTGRKEGKLLVFTETKRKCDEITRMVRRDGFNALCIHGDKAQPERDWVLQEFREGKCEILIATDVAARGLGMFYVPCFRGRFSSPRGVFETFLGGLRLGLFWLLWVYRYISSGYF